MSRYGLQRGFAAIESLLAVPVLLFVGLGALQFALLLQARHAVNHALIEAARAGSVNHADPAAVREGLARGLAPWLFGASDLPGHEAAVARSMLHVAQAEAVGWLRLEQVSPTTASFEDWAEPARDAGGEPIPTLREIPNDDLVHRATRTQPASGVAGLRAGEPIGAASGQTLTDANLLRLNLSYGVPLNVPVIGRLIASTLRAWYGCASSPVPRWGLLRLDAGTAVDPARAGSYAGVVAGGSPCAVLGSGRDGTAVPRWPVELAATVRMQSPAREAATGGPGPRPADHADTPGRRLPGYEPEPVPQPAEPQPTPPQPSGSQTPTPPGPSLRTDTAEPARTPAPTPASDRTAHEVATSRPPTPTASEPARPDPAFCTAPG